MGDVTSSITDAAVASMTPAIQQVMVNDILPMLGVFMVTGAVAAAFIGTWFGHRAQRVASGVRRNPVPRTYVSMRRRRSV
jgi:uncharacterized membrane protein YfcA